ncbi:OmpA family protein [Endozoicomonas sp. OPT23]|uniref:OmpA family protein n=1 Tax=Endozoicomonas sp. OPT23 TaxID=2072845 RepID=UPI001890F33F|nr:OmpA family protein [Endozoicomonas sp. OPT23]
MQFRLYSPVILADSHQVEIYSVGSPLLENSERELLSAKKKLPVGESVYKQRVIYSDKNVKKILGSLIEGKWLEVDVLSKSRVVQTLIIPAVDFKQTSIEFNSLRNTLPPIGWGTAQSIDLRFDVGQSGLSDSHERLLDHLIQFLNYDETVTSVTIDGHSDVNGQRLSNLTLSGQRSKQVEGYLLAKGLNQKLLKAVRQHGQRYPLAGMPDDMNRRVEIRLSRSVLPAKETLGDAVK